jgi:hypothetical protein
MWVRLYIHKRQTNDLNLIQHNTSKIKNDRYRTLADTDGVCSLDTAPCHVLRSSTWGQARSCMASLPRSSHIVPVPSIQYADTQLYFLA